MHNVPAGHLSGKPDGAAKGCCKIYFPDVKCHENKKCIFAALKKTIILTAITISPNNTAQMRLLVALAKEMKMEYHTVELQRRTGLDEAIEDIEKGRVYKAESVDDMMNQILE